jgi:hypothetical protein
MRNEHFAEAGDWREAAGLVTFKPVEPRFTAGFSLQSLAIHVRDHRRRELAVGERTLEAHYGGFVLSEARSTKDGARQKALETSYGAEARDVRVAGHEGKSYELGPEVAADDIDGRMPAVVTWCDDEMHYLIASGELSADVLLRIAESVYARARKRRRE